MAAEASEELCENCMNFMRLGENLRIVSDKCIQFAHIKFSSIIQRAIALFFDRSNHDCILCVACQTLAKVAPKMIRYQSVPFALTNCHRIKEVIDNLRLFFHPYKGSMTRNLLPLKLCDNFVPLTTRGIFERLKKINRHCQCFS